MPRPRKYINPSPRAVSLSRPKALKREIAHESQIQWNEDTIRYGEQDALPLKIASIVDQSPATKACIRTISKFIKGAKFTSDELMKKKIDKNGTTLWQFHSNLCDMLGLFDGLSVNFKFDGSYKITNSYILSFESCRMKKPDEKGNISTITYNPYYGTSEYKQEDTIEYPVFNIENVSREISEHTKEGKTYRGQVYYYGKTSPLHRFYPVPGYWSGQHWINIDAKIQEFHANNLDKNFLLSVIWNVIGDPDQPSKNPKYNLKVKGEDGITRISNPKTVGEEFNEMISEALAGSSQGGAGIAFWSGNVDTATKVSAFPTNSNHDLFTTLQDLTTKNITIATQVPGILANIQEGQSLGGDGNEMRAAIELMQSRVGEEQQLLMDFYNEVLLPNLAEPTDERVEIVNFVPITVPVDIQDKFWEVLTPEEKRRWMAKNLPGVELDPVVTTAPAQPVEPLKDEQGNIIPAEAAQVNDALKGLKLSDINRMSSIVAKVANGKMTYDQAKIILQGYGLTEEQINAWLVKPEET